MSANFEIVAKIKAMKETDNFRPFEERTFDSGWKQTRLRFNAISGNNRFALEIVGGKWSDEKKNKILTYSRATEGEKSKQIEIPWADRKSPEVIEKVAGWRIYTCDLLDYDTRKNIEENGTEEEKTSAAKKKHQFIEKIEMAELVQKVLKSGKYDDAKFRILGTVDFQYYNGNYYRNFTVNKMYRVADDTECKAEMTLDTYYTEESLDTESYNDTKKYFFNCWTDYYFSQIKSSRFVPMSLVIKGGDDEKAEKRMAGFKKKLTAFDDEAEVRKISLVCDMIDGAESQAITYDDLDEDTRDDIDCGLITLEEAIRGLGGSMFGSRIQETRVKSIARNSVKGSEATVYSMSDLAKLPVPDAEPADEVDDVDIPFPDDDEEI